MSYWRGKCWACGEHAEAMPGSRISLCPGCRVGQDFDSSPVVVFRPDTIEWDDPLENDGCGV